MVGWLIVEDLATVLALVLLPALADSFGSGQQGAAGLVDGQLRFALGVTLAKVALFVAVALIVGTRVVPWLLMQVTRTDSRELFTLAVLATALGIAYGSAELFGVSFALGAFFCRRHPERVRAQPQGGRRLAPAARCLRRALLRLSRHVVRSHDHRA